MAETRLQREANPRKILYIEDNRENRMLVRAVLEAEGYTIVEAEDGLAGIEAAVREEPALILLDIYLPSVDGYEVVAILKSFPVLATTPVIAVTAYAMESDRQRTLVAGCDGYIQKPIDVDLFPRQVAEFMKGKRERFEERQEGHYLRELNQRLVYRLLNQVEELKRLNHHFVRRATQLEELHRAVQDITSEVGVAPLLDRLLPAIARALETTTLTVELSDPAGVRVAVTGTAGEPRRSVLAEAGSEQATEWVEAEWKLPLTVRGRPLGVMLARHVLPPGAKADEEQLLKIVANQVAIAVENARLYQGVTRQAAEQQSLVEAGRLITGSLQVSEVLQRLTDLVRTRLDVDVVEIWLTDETPGDVRLHASAGELRTSRTDRFHHEPGRALVGWIMDHVTPLVVPDVQVDPRVKRVDWVKAEGLVSFLGVPLLLKDEPVGVLEAWSRGRRAFAPEEVALAEALATSASIAIQNASLYEETQTRLRDTETLLSVSQAVGSTLDLAEVARRTTREMVHALGADVGGAWLLDPERNELMPLAGYHVPKDLSEVVSRTVLPFGNRLVEEVTRLRGPLYASDSQSDPRLDHPFLQLLPHKSALIFPMWLKDEIVGGFAIVWVRETHRLTPDELRLAEGIARQAAVAIDNARLLEAERQARAREAVFVEIVKELAVEDDFERIFSLIGRRVCELIGTDAAVISLVEGDEIALRGSYGIENPELLSRRRRLSESRVGRVVLTQRPYACPEMSTDPHWRDSVMVGSLGYRAILDVPILLRGEVIGVLGAMQKSPRSFSAEDTALLVSLAGHTAVALDRTNLIRDMKARLNETETLLSISQAISATLDLTEMMRRVAKETARALGADMAGAYLADDTHEYLRPIAGYHVPKRLREAFVNCPLTLRNHRFLEEAWRHQQAVYSSDAPADPRIDRETLRRFPHRSVLFVPMTIKAEPIGGLFVVWWEAQHPFSSEEIRLVEGLARQAAIAVENARLYEGVKRQMTELQQTQAQLIQSTKLAAIGELAANVAHEINNPLTSVLGFASFLAERLQPGEPMREELDLIRVEATRARDIVRDLLDFSRQREFVSQPTDFNVVVEQTLGLVRRQGLLETHELSETYASDLPMVDVDVSQMKQVVLNIINNAVHAMPDGGTLTVRTGANDGQVYVEITDTGTGIAPEILDKIFDPFFTTKPDVTGTGLGLSVSLGIVQRHGGTIEVKTELGKGSTFTIRLPPTANHAASEDEAATA
ncbi:MAG: GAF domain-containing protein [Candidatus Rokubacteria bacterium]|nr:GAF domain-containing protein [Candidatus Rokubacteria bacterium]